MIHSETLTAAPGDERTRRSFSDLEVMRLMRLKMEMKMMTGGFGGFEGNCNCGGALGLTLPNVGLI